VLDLPFVHVPCADGADVSASVTLAECEDEKDWPTRLAFPDGAKALFGARVRHIRSYRHWLREQLLDLG